MRDAQMRAAVLTAPGVVELREVTRPTPAPSQVLVQVEGCGICGSNVPSWEGRPWFQYPMAPGKPGHEAWGYVAGVGAQVRGVREGDRVACLSEHAFAEYDVADAQSLVLLPSELAELDMPLEPLGCAMNVWERCAVEPGQDVAVVGVGFLGALLVQLASSAGAQVVALARRPHALALAHASGAQACVPLEAPDDTVLQDAMQLVGQDGYDCVIEAVGVQRTLDLASRLCKVRGRLVIAGYHQDGPRVVDMQSWNWRGLDVINAHEREVARYVHGMQAGLDALLDGRIALSPLLSHREPLAGLDRAMELLRTRPEGFTKAVVLP